MAEPLLRVAHLSKRYGALRVTEDVSLTLAPGSVHAVIGPNGAGKTTLVHQISGLVRADAGQVLLAGEDITALPMHARARRGLGRTFQITSVVPSFTARENVALAVQAHEGSSFRFFRPATSEAALNGPAMAALEEVGLADRAAVPAASLSHGERRQLELAIALAQAPRVLLLDEPLAGAGQEETERLIALLSRLRARMAMLLIEHDMQAVFALADTISVLVYGSVVASGPPEAIRTDPAVRAAYLGEDF